MGILRDLFGPSSDEIWRRLCLELGGDYVEGGFFKASKVRISHKQWTITFDTYSDDDTTYTRIRAPYVNKAGFRFTIYRKGIISSLGKLLGMQDVEVGHSRFDDDFIIQGNDETRLRALFANERIRTLIERQPKIHLAVKDDEGWFGASFPSGVDELYFRVPGVIKDVAQLKQLYELFSEILNHLCQIGSAYQDDPRIEL